MMLVFDPTKVPRSIGREEWRLMHRWCRVASREISEQNTALIKNLGAFGSTHPEFVARAVERLVNPPILLGPWQ